MPKKYRRKPQELMALKTYVGQPMADIEDFLSWSPMLVSSSERGAIFTGPIQGDIDVTPGDYILQSYDGQVTVCKANEFEKVYEEEVNPQELHYVIMKYGFLVKDAEMMLRDELIKPILLAPLVRQNQELKRTKRIELAPRKGVDIERIAGEFAKKLEKAVSKFSE